MSTINHKFLCAPSKTKIHKNIFYSACFYKWKIYGPHSLSMILEYVKTENCELSVPFHLRILFPQLISLTFTYGCYGLFLLNCSYKAGYHGHLLSSIKRHLVLFHKFSKSNKIELVFKGRYLVSQKELSLDS